jgi:MFS family permease
VPFAALFSRALLPRVVVGGVTLITTNTLIFGFVNWIPTFFVQQGLSITRSFAYAMVIALGAPLGCALGAFSTDRLGRRACIIGASVLTIAMGAIYPFVAAPAALLGVGLLLIVGIYILTSILYGVYTSELFPTEVRLRANGICNMFGRGATIVTPFIVVALFRGYGVTGVLGLMIGLLIVQIVVVARWGIEPAKRGLEELDAEGGDRVMPRRRRDGGGTACRAPRPRRSVVPTWTPGTPIHLVDLGGHLLLIGNLLLEYIRPVAVEGGLIADIQAIADRRIGVGEEHGVTANLVDELVRGQ